MTQDEGNQRGGYRLQEDHLREMDSCSKRTQQFGKTRGIERLTLIIFVSHVLEIQ